MHIRCAIRGSEEGEKKRFRLPVASEACVFKGMRRKHSGRGVHPLTEAGATWRFGKCLRVACLILRKACPLNFSFSYAQALYQSM
jgi:hypothetical protein